MIKFRDLVSYKKQEFEGRQSASHNNKNSLRVPDEDEDEEE